MIKTIIKIYLIMAMSIGGFGALATGIVPAPLEVRPGKGNFMLSTGTVLLAPSRFAVHKAQMLDILRGEFNLALKKQGNSPKGVIVLSYERRLEPELGKEGYAILVQNDTVLISSVGPAGMFYGIQSLRQLISRQPDGSLSIPCIKVKDRPRLAKRIFMLDEGRHFKGAQVVKGILDQMALLKMNTFHWHLTEDQGWRIEIKKYPRLTSIGGFRDSTERSGWGAEHKEFRVERHGGFYTQEQIKEIVAYAADRHIQVIPEIDMPGHSTAAIAAYPWLSAADEKVAVATTWGVLPNAYHVADPRVRDFLKDILEEVIALFPSKIIHIGGDEVDYSSWKRSKVSLDFIRERNLASPADLQLWFSNEIASYLRSRGRQMMGWNDIMGEKLLDHFNRDSGDYKITGKLDTGTIVHFWLGRPELILKAIRDGHQVVNAFHERTYLNYPYEKVSLAMAYGFDPVPLGLDATEQGRVIGVSCQLWSEYVPDVETLNYQLYPRLAANAEVGWSMPEHKDFSSFIARMAYFRSRWKLLGIGHGPFD